jgi:hypothetical protein
LLRYSICGGGSLTNLFSVTATLDAGASGNPAQELGALEQRLVSLGAVRPAATIDERTQTVNVHFDVTADHDQIRGVIDRLAQEFTQLAAWTLSGIAYYCA